MKLTSCQVMTGESVITVEAMVTVTMVNDPVTLQTKVISLAHVYVDI